MDPVPGSNGSDHDSWLDQAEFADNPEPRCPVVLLLDTSTSMRGGPIDAINDGIRGLARDLQGDSLAALRVEIAVVTFGGEVQALDVRSETPLPIPFDAAQAFVTVDQFHPPTLKTNGDTPMGAAVRHALDLLRDRKEIYRAAGLDYFRPWIFLITDGAPTDRGWESAAEAAKAEEARKGVSVFPIGVEGADLAKLGRFAHLPPLKLRSDGWKELFVWVSKSLSAVAQSRPGDQVPLPATSWASVDTSR